MPKLYPFLLAGGEMGQLTRNFDWSTTVLGSPDEWPQSLRTTVSIILTSKFPMFLWWGPELIQFYNDAYRPSMGVGTNGKHPTALGQRGADCWPEIWPTIKPLIDQILAGGESTWSEDQLIPIYRNGRLEDVYWTFSYSPVSDDTGQPTGVLVTCTETTEKVINVRDLKESKEQLEFAIEAAELGTWDLNPLTNKFTANARLKDWFGVLPEEEVLLSRATEVIAEKDRQRVVKAIGEALDYASGGRYAIDYTIVNPLNRSERIVRAKGKAWFTDDKIAYRFNGTLQDITSERKAQEETVAAQQLADMAIKSAGIGLFRVDMVTGKIVCSPAYAAIITGDATKTGLSRQGFASYVHPDDLLLLEANNKAGGETGVFYYQLRVIWDDGSIHHITVMGGLVLDESGKPIAYSGTVRDITDQEKQRQTLQEAEERFAQAQHQSDTLFRNVTNSSPTGLWLADEAGLITYLNKTLVEWTGKALEDLMGRGWADAIIEQDRQRSIDTFATAVGARAHYEALFRLKRGDGSIVWCQAAGDPYYREDGSYAGYAGFCLDINELVAGREALEQSEAKFRALIEEAPIATCLFVGRDMKIEVANEIMIGYWGKDQTVLGLPLSEAVPELHGQPFLSILDEVFTTGKTHEAKATRAELKVDGALNTYYFDFTYKPLRNTAGEVYGIMDMAVDVTQQVRIQQQIEESEERYRVLSSELDEQVQERTRQLEDSIQDLKRSNDNLEKFAYIASHDLQEPLRKIQQFGDLLKTRYETPSGESSAYLERMQSAANRMSRLIRDLLSFSRISTQRDSSGVVSLSEVINSVLVDLDLRIQETGAVIVVEPLPVVSGDPLQLGQLFQNLLSNALKFRQAERTPRIELTVKRIAASDLPLLVRPARLTASYYQIDVTDNGIGFEQKYVDRIFQVFQRLHGKSEFEGTGIGLAICEKVVANHGGGITATSKPGQGATFSIYFPV
ncbi:PAS domain S-box protein [Spirosoma sp. HMF3257]|uniref:histidine kinase n=1 Tax=Spirosoma telluris TaxID=2183553 RepID=A0A327NW48_9BACT|nr:PAS domain S-box protein [Spirosoma telluris]RAI78074.1 PAS domain-containing sensor histidine kinase [Spirosoma telluris]